jgi:hypothetical protein
MSKSFRGLILLIMVSFLGWPRALTAEDKTAEEKTAEENKMGAPPASKAVKSAPSKNGQSKTGPSKTDPSKTESPARRSASRPDQFQKASEALLELQRKMRALEEESLKRKRGMEDRLQDLLEEKRLVERSTAALTQRVTELEKDLDGKKRKLSTDEAEVSRLAAESAQVLDLVRKFLSRVDKHIDEGIPWAVDQRKDGVERARRALAGPGISPAAALALASRVHAAEEALGRTIEPGRITLNPKGDERSVPAFHIGLLSVVYASEDGSLLGYVHAGQKLEEGRIDTESADSKQSAGKALQRVMSGYAAALAQLQRKLTPRIIDVYVPTLSVGNEERR